MALIKSKTQKLEEWAKKRAAAIWENLHTNHLWQRMFKNTLATTLAVILALIPAVVSVYGKAVYLAPITTVFGHPGRRTGMMVEALVLAVGGTLVGVAWSIFGIYLSSLIYDQNAPAAYTIRGIFLTIALLVHGFLRSHSPRLFISLLLLIIVCVVSLTSTATVVSNLLATQILYPILTAVGILILVNILVFPELSSDFLGTTTIETLAQTVDTLRDAGQYFINVGEKVGKGSPKTLPEENLEINSKEDEATPKPKAKTPFLQKLTGLSQKSKEKDKVADNQLPKFATLKSLTEQKTKLREKLTGCKAAQQECNFELTFAVLPPEALKEISVIAMTKLVANAIALIGACESKYALMGDETENVQSQIETAAKEAGNEGDSEMTPDGPEDEDPSSEQGRRSKDSPQRPADSQEKRKSTFEREKENLELVKPKREIEFGDAELLRFLVTHIAKPLANLQEGIDKSVEVVISCLAYCYDVAKLPSGSKAPTGIHLSEIDVYVDILTESLNVFDKDSAIALERAASIHKVQQAEVDIMPRMEIFLISLFLLNLRQAALHILEMLRHSRVIVEKRQSRHNRHRIYAPQINWRKWLASGGDEDSLALPDNARQGVRTCNSDPDAQENSFDSSDDSLHAKGDVEANPPSTSKEAKPRKPIPKKSTTLPTKKEFSKTNLASRVRNGLADGIEYLVGSEDVIYAVKIAVAVLLVSWPAFLYQWNQWYSLNRGLWAALQLVLITEVAIGTSVMTFALRAVGTTLGCVWGYVAYEVGNGNRIVCVVILIIGIIPSTYLQLGSKYIKAGMVSIISMCIVCLATTSQTVPGDTATENFLKRFIAFLIGGVLALILQFTFIPVKARDRLVESLASSVTQIIEMEACLAYGIETESNLDVHSAVVSERFDHAKGKAQAALAAAAAFLPFCANEPRLKGSFKGLALIYAEILYVLHAIVDRMDNMIHLRYSYGSGVLEELNTQVFPYRRNVAGAITIVLFAVHEALTTKLPLPQFLPSARLAHLRMVNRVREVVIKKEASEVQTQDTISRSEVEFSMVKRVIRQKFLSWNAASAGQIETIEFLEELIDLTKLLVGANEFRSGMLTRPTYRDFVERTNPRDVTRRSEDEAAEERDIMPPEGQEHQKTTILRKRPTFSKNKDAENGTELPEDKKPDEEELPRSLQRVRSRRIEEMNLHRYKSIEQDSMTRGGKLLPGEKRT